MNWERLVAQVDTMQTLLETRAWAVVRILPVIPNLDKRSDYRRSIAESSTIDQIKALVWNLSLESQGLVLGKKTQNTRHGIGYRP